MKAGPAVSAAHGWGMGCAGAHGPPPVEGSRTPGLGALGCGRFSDGQGGLGTQEARTVMDGVACSAHSTFFPTGCARPQRAASSVNRLVTCSGNWSRGLGETQGLPGPWGAPQGSGNVLEGWECGAVGGAATEARGGSPAPRGAAPVSPSSSLGVTSGDHPPPYRIGMGRWGAGDGQLEEDWTGTTSSGSPRGPPPALSQLCEQGRSPSLSVPRFPTHRMEQSTVCLRGL